MQFRSADPEGASAHVHGYTVRQAGESDARAVAQIHVETWRAAYAGIVPDSVLQALSVDSLTDMWRAAVRKQELELWVAEDQGKIAGWAALSASRDADANASCGELQAIYVDAAHWESGFGSALVEHTCHRLAQRGFGRMTLWVLQANERALRFYERRGFAADGATKQFELAGKPLTEIRLAIKLQSTIHR